MIKFFGEPLREIKSKQSGKVMFRFDTKGEFITDDLIIIDRAMGYFDYMPMKAEPTGKKIAKTFVEPTIKIETKNDKEEISEQKKTLKCKYCEFEADNMGVLMQHYKEHKKEGGR
jgi:hypothetical protein